MDKIRLRELLRQLALGRTLDLDELVEMLAGPDVPVEAPAEPLVTPGAAQ